MKVALFEKLKSGTKLVFFNIIQEPSYVCGVKGHIPRSKVI